jgi:DNA primase
MDVIALYMGGMKEVVAPLGTAITETQLTRMWNLSKEPTMCFDGDNAGQKAMLRASALATPLLKPGYTLKFATMPIGLDPDDVIKSGGADKLADILAKTSSLSDILWHNELIRSGTTTPEARALLEKNLNSIANNIKDASVGNHYRNFFREKLRNTLSGKNKYSKTSKDLPIRLTNLDKLPDITAKSRIGAESLLLLILMHSPSTLNNNDVLEEFINIDFSDSKLDKLRIGILEAHNLEESSNKEILEEHLEKAGYKYDILRLKELGLYHEDNSNDVDKTLNYWKYTVSLYNLATLREECSKFASIMTEDSELKANEIRRQIQKLEENILQMELAFVEN